MRRVTAWEFLERETGVDYYVGAPEAFCSHVSARFCNAEGGIDTGFRFENIGRRSEAARRESPRSERAPRSNPGMQRFRHRSKIAAQSARHGARDTERLLRRSDVYAMQLEQCGER